ncbi:MAG: hypothetical protein Tp125SUR00d2C35697761_11 [Prokaryotic dsDNA virus sp.]|nr:MAG: hypothetical protein Tp125SUR00d2C35697761_11 [Prokaryotic dsDNA virus sp.]QDP66060.1 MAG: hypothetical protein Unbinned4336contig1000_25 [Prokaryotic dsDNA virus sp.]|tara:strand:- start:27503 stop:27946 length:444 start_codon:yes stop_codon:yes gene_type:complete
MIIWFTQHAIADTAAKIVQGNKKKAEEAITEDTVRNLTKELELLKESIHSRQLTIRDLYRKLEEDILRSDDINGQIKELTKKRGRIGRHSEIVSDTVYLAHCNGQVYCKQKDLSNQRAYIDMGVLFHDEESAKKYIEEAKARVRGTL